jgi:predicted dehydrogenase
MARAYGPGSYDPAYEKRGVDYPLAYVRWTENRNMEEFLRLIGRKQVQVAPLVTHEFPLEEATQAYDTILNPETASLAVLLRYPTAKEPTPAYTPQRKVFVQGASPASEGSLGVALVGAGNLARWAHLPNLKKMSGVELRAVYSASGARGKSYAMRFGAQYACSEYEEVLRDPNIHIVLIVSRNQDHAPQALAALNAGKHVFVEKPMALTAEECRQLTEAVERSGKQLTVGFNRRFAPYYMELKKQLARRSGPAVVQARVNSPGISGGYWMADPAIGGAILGEACHFVDLLYWLLESEPVKVTSYSLPVGRKEPVGENNIVASFRFADGSIGNLTYCTVGSRTSGGERVEVFGEGIGAMTEDFKRLIIAGGMRRTQSRWWAEKGYAAQMQDFIDSIRQGKAPGVTVRDGVRSTVGCLRMMASARDGRPYEITLD